MQFTDEQQRFIDEHYQLLPVDADGVPILVGDVMEFYGFDVDRQTVRTVDGVGANGVFFAWCGGCGYQQQDASRYRHHHPDTWERIIEDAMRLGYTDPDNEHLEERLVDRCKALAGDAS